jgi:hypothetical protein
MERFGHTHRIHAAMLEPDASTDGQPVFVDDGRRRNQVGRLATTTFGLMLAAWLAALAAGVIGAGPFPQLGLLGANHEEAVPEVRPQTSDDPPAGRAASRNVGPPSSSNSETRRAAPIHPGTGAPSTPESGGGTATGGDGAAPPTVGTTGTPTQIQPPGATTTQAPSAETPSPTPPESGQQSAISSGPSATTSPDVASGTTSPDGSGTPTSTVESGTTNAPDAPISDSLPTG